MAATALTRRKLPAAQQNAGWKIDQNEEACYIDILDDEEEKENSKDLEPRSYSQWHTLPDLLLEEIFSYLDVRDRYYASLVCRQWYRAFYLPNVWRNFLVDDHTLTRQKYNYYSGWQHCLDHARTQQCLVRIGRYLRGLQFQPEVSFNNIYQFIVMLSWSISMNSSMSDICGVGARIRSIVYIFPCNMAQANDPDGIKLFGTGGQLLKGLKDLLSQMRELRTLKLIDFVLERYEAKHLLDEVLETCCLKMRVLNLVNVTTLHCPIMHVGLFLNLQILTISPQNIDDDVLQLLADSKVRHLHLLQNWYTPSYNQITACSYKAWRILRRDNPRLRVHLRLESLTDGEVVFQPEAPIHSITYSTPKTQVKTDLVLNLVDHYKHTLSVYGYEQLPRFSSPKPFQQRIDSLMLLICRQCPNLNTMLIRERVSTSTVLLIARTAQNLRHLYVRRFAVILRCDWPRHPEWTPEFYMWLRRASRSYESVETEVSQILGRPWRFLSDSDYKRIALDEGQQRMA